MKVLVIGGTQFMGRNLVNRLLELEYDVTVLNRGKTPWPFEGKAITRLKCDRLNDRKRFRELLFSKRNQFDVIVDFVAFSKSNVRDVVASSSCHYIFISTDSVHMACLPPNAQRLLKETDAVIPEKELSSELRKIRGSYQIRYGLEKLKAEQYLHKKAKDRYTCLRFPDVFGPHDNQDGFVNTMQSLKKNERIGRCIHRDSSKTYPGHSFIFVLDAVSAIVSAIKIGPMCTSLNVCHDEVVEWTEFVEIMATSLSISSKHIQWDDSEEPEMISVTAGPIDNSMAKRRLVGWKPSKLKTAIEVTVRWYEKDPLHVVETLRMADSSSDSEEEEKEEEERKTKKRPHHEMSKSCTSSTSSSGVKSSSFKFHFSI